MQALEHFQSLLYNKAEATSRLTYQHNIFDLSTLLSNEIWKPS